jgi:hypothetical protein
LGRGISGPERPKNSISLGERALHLVPEGRPSVSQALGFFGQAPSVRYEGRLVFMVSPHHPDFNRASQGTLEPSDRAWSSCHDIDGRGSGGFRESLPHLPFLPQYGQLAHLPHPYKLPHTAYIEMRLSRAPASSENSKPVRRTLLYKTKVYFLYILDASVYRTPYALAML